MAKALINREKVLQDIYNNLAQLGFGDLLMVSTQLNEHIWNCWTNHQQKMEEMKNVKSSDKRDGVPAGQDRSGKGRPKAH